MEQQLVAACRTILTENKESSTARLELEARLAPRHGTGGTAAAVWLRLKSDLEEALGGDNIVTTQLKTDSYYMGARGQEPGAWRKRTQDGIQDKGWEFKVKPTHFDADPTGYIRYSVTREYTLGRKDGPTRELPRPHTRTGVRHSFTLSRYTRIDMSKMEQDKRTSYEVEVEYTGITSKRIPVFLEEVKAVLKLYLWSPVLYSEKELTLLQETVQAALPRPAGVAAIPGVTFDIRTLSHARDIKPDDFGIFLPGPGAPRWTVTRKTDGERRLLVIGPLGHWLIYPPYIYTKISEDATRSLAIFDVELLTSPPADSNPKERGVPGFYTGLGYLAEMIDCLYVKDVSDKQATASLGEDIRAISLLGEKGRLARGQAFIEVYRKVLESKAEPLKLEIATKAYRAFSTPEEFFSLVGSIYADDARARQLIREGVPPATGRYHPIDGIILTPDTFYIDSFPRVRGRPVSYPLIKWKPAEQLTTDFRVEPNGAGGWTLLMSNVDRVEVPFAGISGFPFDATSQIDPDVNPQLLRDPGAIVEFSWNPETAKLEAYRPRPNKDGPNRQLAAEHVWRNLMRPITLADMTGNSLYFLTRYHNKVKRGLLGQLGNKHGKILLDLGSGYGGDLGKWQDFAQVIAVEPSLANIDQFAERYSQMEAAPKVTLIHATGQDWQTILPWVDRITQGRGVDAVALMDSLTFFWDTESSLTDLVKTVTGALRQGGKLLWKVLDGDLVTDLLEPPFSLTGEIFQEVEFGASAAVHSAGRGAAVPPFPTVTSGLAPPRAALSGQTPYLARISRDTESGDDTAIWIDLPSSKIVGRQKEWLTHLEDLRQLLKEDFGLVGQFRCNDNRPNFLSAEVGRLSGLYTYGIFVRNSATPQNISQGLRLRMDKLVKLQQLQVRQIGHLTEPSSSSRAASSATIIPEDLPSSLELDEEELRQILKEPSPPAKIHGTYLPILPKKAGWELLDTSSWWAQGQLYRLYTNPDGHCLVHSILYATSPAYQQASYTPEYPLRFGKTDWDAGEEMTGDTAREYMANALRDELVWFLMKEAPGAWAFPGLKPAYAKAPGPVGALKPNMWEVIYNGDFIAEHFRQMIKLAEVLRDASPNPENGLRRFSRTRLNAALKDLLKDKWGQTDYSINGLIALLRSSKFLGDESLKLLAVYLEVDILVVEGIWGSEEQPQAIPNAWFSGDPRAGRPFCVITQVGKHFEVCALRDKNGHFVTLWPADHPLKQAFLEGGDGRLEPPPEKTDPLYHIIAHRCLSMLDRADRTGLNRFLWFLLDRFWVRTSKGSILVKKSTNRLYHHLWCMSRNIQTGWIGPSPRNPALICGRDGKWLVPPPDEGAIATLLKETVGYQAMPYHSHIALSVQAAEEAESEKHAQRVIDRNANFVAFLSLGELGSKKNAEGVERIYPRREEVVKAIRQDLATAEE